jgi:hypothetical protein
MNCRRIGELIPLYIEGDLEPNRSEEVRAHLDSCAHCSRICNQYGESQALLRSYVPPEFDAAFFDGLKRTVLAGIEREESRPSFFQLLAQEWRRNTALATAIALLIVFGMIALYAYRDRAGSSPTGEGRATAGPAHKDEEPGVRDNRVSPETPQQPAPRTGPERKVRPKPAYAKSREIPMTEIEPELISQGTVPEPMPDLASIDPLNDPALRNEMVEQMDELERQVQWTGIPTSEPELMRIEIQTSDPDIRIIWFASKGSDSKPEKPVNDTD